MSNAILIFLIGFGLQAFAQDVDPNIPLVKAAPEQTEGGALVRPCLECGDVIKDPAPQVSPLVINMQAILNQTNETKDFIPKDLFEKRTRNPFQLSVKKPGSSLKDALKFDMGKGESITLKKKGLKYKKEF
jgi:hypothetical protein